METITLATKGKWKHFLVSELDERQLQELIVLVKPLYTWFSPKRATAENIRARLTRQDTSCVDIIFLEEKVVGWGVYYIREIDNQKILYRDGTIVDPEHGSKGIYHSLIELSLNREAPDHLVTRTQNPRVYESFQKYSQKGIYPRLDNVIPPQHIQKIAQEIEPSVDPETLIVRGVYEGDRFQAEYHTSRDPKIKEFFLQKLQPPDAFLLVVLV